MIKRQIVNEHENARADQVAAVVPLSVAMAWANELLPD